MEELWTNRKKKYGNIEIETEDQGATCNLCFVQEEGDGWNENRK